MHAESLEGRYFVPLADAYRTAGDADGAIDLLRAGLERHPDYPSAHIVLGRCFLDRRDPGAAEAEFRRVLSLDPQNLIALGSLGELAASDGRDEEAERWYLDLLEVDPMNDDARAALASLEVHVPSASSPVVPEDYAGSEGRQEDAGPAPDTETTDPGSLAAGELDQNPKEMVDLTGDDGVMGVDDEVVVTETIAELYTRQGFHTRAADVYRELIRRRGGDASLEARLRNVEELAAGGPRATAGKPSESPQAESVSDEPADGGEPIDASPSPTGTVDTDLADSRYTAIGSDADLSAPGSSASDLPAGSSLAAMDDAGKIPQGLSGLGEITAEGSGFDPFADSFAAGFAGLESAGSQDTDAVEPDGSQAPLDPFADSFAAGFAGLESAGSQDADAVEPDGSQAPLPPIGSAASPDASPARGTIGEYLRSIALWSPGLTPDRGPESSDAPYADPGPTPADPDAPVSSNSGDEGLPWPSLAPPSSESPTEGILDGLDWIGSEFLLEGEEPASGPTEPPPGGSQGQVFADDLSADFGFDKALGYSPPEQDTPHIRKEGGSPGGNEPSGTDDPQLRGGADDPFPWEIPVSEKGADSADSLPPADLDPRYASFDDSQGAAPLADTTPHAERVPLEDVVQEPAETGAGPGVGGGADADLPTSASGFAGIPRHEDEPVPEEEAGGATSSIASPDDDDLESFQAWLRSLKR